MQKKFDENALRTPRDQVNPNFNCGRLDVRNAFSSNYFCIDGLLHLVGRWARSRAFLLRSETDWKKYLRFFLAKVGEPRKSNFLNLRVHMSGPCKFSRFESD